MKTGELSYRRQFLMSNTPMNSLSCWHCTVIGSDAYIYSHPDLETVSVELDGRTFVLLGYVFDTGAPEKPNEEILTDIAHRSNSFEALVTVLKRYTGRYVVIYRDSENLNVIHDALAVREVYYCTTLNRVICGSQPNLIQEFAEPRISVTDDQQVLGFYYNDMRKVRNGRLWVGDETFYQGIKHLLPNHYLNTRTKSGVRYWPSKKIEPLRFGEVVQRSCSFLQGALAAVTHRHSIMLAVTSGNDSRTLLAASRGVKEKIYFFINREQRLADDHPDIRVPKAMFEKIDLPFHVHSVDDDVDEQFREVFLNNTFLSNEYILPTIYNVYYRNHNNRMNVLGVGEIGRSYYGEAPEWINGYYLARSLKYRNSPYAVKQCQKWLDAAYPVAKQTGVNILTLFLWEQLLGNWGAVGNSESDIAIEEFDPFNSHYLYETMLSVEKKYARHGGDNILFKEMIHAMWPELLEFPINPPRSLRERLKVLSGSIGLEKYLKNLVYQFGEISYHRTAKHTRQSCKTFKTVR